MGDLVVEQILVFVSHTLEMSQQPGGESYVRAAESAVNAIDGAKARHMEYFPAADMSPAHYSVQQLERADIFVAIVGFQRGSTVPGELRSYTELEFDAATELGKVRLLFLLHPSAPSAARADPEQLRFRRKLEQSGATVAYFTDAGDLKYKISQAVTRSIRQHWGHPGGHPSAPVPPRRPDGDRPARKRLSCAGALLLVVPLVLLLGLGAWSAVAGRFPPWSAEPIRECTDVTARVTDSSPTTFGGFVSGATLHVAIENQSAESISVPSSSEVTARGATGTQYAVDASLADQSWFFAIDIQPRSTVNAELGLASDQGGADTVTVVIPQVGAPGPFPSGSGCRVTLEPVTVTFAD